MAKKYEREDLHQVEESTSITIPVNMKKTCKDKGISYKQCFLVGFNHIVNGGVNETKQRNKEINDLIEGNGKLHRKLTELSLKVHDLEKKFGVENVEK